MFDLAGTRHLLVVAPHADDEVLGAGGLILRAGREGWDVTVLFMTVAGFDSQASGQASSAAERMAEAKAACRSLGVGKLIVCEETAAHHLALDSLPLSKLVAPIEAAIKECAPAALALPWGGHYHQDHQATAAACAAAIRPAPAAAGRTHVPVVLAYGHAGGDWASPNAFRPTYFVDLDGLLDAKTEAMGCYASQLCAFPHGRSAEGLAAWHRHWGIHAGCAYAEPFELVRYVD